MPSACSFDSYTTSVVQMHCETPDLRDARVSLEVIDRGTAGETRLRLHVLDAYGNVASEVVVNAGLADLAELVAEARGGDS